MSGLPTSRRHVRRRERARRRRFLAGTCLTLALLAFSLVRSSRNPSVQVPEPEAPSARAPLALATEPVADAPEEAPRPLYPYAIISKGAASAQELAAAMKADPVVAEHFRDFDLSRTRIVRLTQARVAHVSYRIGNSVFWTRRALLLNAGETLLTDGRHYARTRCGNQLAESPAAISAQEPSAETLNTPLPRTVGYRAPLPGPAPTPQVMGAGPVPGDPDSGGLPDDGSVARPTGGLPPAFTDPSRAPNSVARPPGSTTRIAESTQWTAPAADPADPVPGGDPDSKATPPNAPTSPRGYDGGDPGDPGDPGAFDEPPVPPAVGPTGLFAPRQPPTESGVPQIPEPAAVAMLVAGGSAWLRRRWSRRERV